MRRVVIPELLDSDEGTPREIEASLRDLRRINRWFGGSATTTALLRRVVATRKVHEMSVLDVGAGPGEAMVDSRRSLARDGVKLRVTLLDRAVAHLPHNGVPSVVGDAFSLPFAANSFDVVACSLFLHHLEPGAIPPFVDEALRVCREAVVINDLERAAAHLALIYAGSPLFSRITRHDSVASVRRAYTAHELNVILERSKARKIEISRHSLFRLGAIAWKENHAGIL